ncbi:MAG: helix-turn-helix domain-containing protein [Candidatus Dormibacteraeota bacterium]|uniref:Helix-turn-helix domain-containing protein n=1 Tax=Candidatus Aeolococcus gillhamiae TaxID=3127015 RepID=A0A934K2Y3_9BACT|nr:helix-turn-helix domain-containing protein [Candidatus Dormibacteraeota bacterium]
MSTPAAVRYSVSEVARMVGVSPSTLRAWEQRGLVRSSRSAAGWRRYDPTDVTRAREVHRLREVDGLAVHAIARRLRVGAARTTRRAPRLASSDVGTGLGKRLRDRRNDNGMSLRALAAAAGVSPSLVSEIERGVVQPSIASLQKLSAALGTTVAALVAVAAPACRVLGGELAPMDIPIPGVRIEDLSGTAELLEPQRFSVEPGQGSGGEYAHEGEEFLYVLEGTLSITLDRHEQFDVAAGMSLCFESTRRHRWWNPGQVVTRVLWINTPRTF